MNNLRSNSKDGRGSGSSKYPKRVVATFPVELQQTLLSQEDREWITNESSDIAGREFHSLAEKGDVQAVRALIDSGLDPNSCDELGTSALLAAVAGQHVAIVHLLLSSGADVDKGNQKGITPLQLACIGADSAVCNAILMHNPQVLKPSGDGRIALHYACESGAEECVRKLLMHISTDYSHQNEDEPHRGFGTHALRPGGSASGVNQQDAEGMTPLHFAIINGNEGVIRRMLQAGADVTVSDKQGRTPLDLAASIHLQPSSLHLLLEQIDKHYHTNNTNVEGGLSLKEATVIATLHQQLEAAQAEYRKSNELRGHTAYTDTYVLVDQEGLLVEDPVSKRVVLHHMKEDAIRYAQQTLKLQNCAVAMLAPSTWLDFCRETMHEWKDDKEEEDPLMVASIRQQQMLKTCETPNPVKHVDPQSRERLELEQSILEITDEIARLRQECLEAEQHLGRLQGGDAHLPATLVHAGSLSRR